MEAEEIQKVIHEAAHVVVTVCLGYSARVEIFSKPTTRTVGDVEIDDVFGETKVLSNDNKSTVPTPREWITMTYAPVAYAVVTGQAVEVWKAGSLTIEGPPAPYFGFGDFTKINIILDGISTSKKERERILRKCTRRARNIICNRIADIETVTEDLLAKRSLTYNP